MHISVITFVQVDCGESKSVSQVFTFNDLKFSYFLSQFFEYLSYQLGILNNNIDSILCKFNISYILVIK